MSRKIFREFAKSKGKEAKEFVELQSEMYQNDTLITKSNSGALEKNFNKLQKYAILGF